MSPETTSEITYEPLNEVDQPSPEHADYEDLPIYVVLVEGPLRQYQEQKISLPRKDLTVHIPKRAYHLAIRDHGEIYVRPYNHRTDNPLHSIPVPHFRRAQAKFIAEEETSVDGRNLPNFKGRNAVKCGVPIVRIIPKSNR